VRGARQARVKRSTWTACGGAQAAGAEARGARQARVQAQNLAARGGGAGAKLAAWQRASRRGPNGSVRAEDGRCKQDMTRAKNARGSCVRGSDAARLGRA
jgi:hypothetical protein